MLSHPVKTFYVYMVCLACLFPVNTITAAVVLKNKGSLKITRGTYLVINGNINISAPVYGDGMLVLTNIPDFTNKTIITRGPEMFCNNVCEAAGNIRITKGSYINNLTIRDGLVNMKSELFIKNILKITISGKLIVNRYNLYINKISGNGTIFENSSGKVINYFNLLTDNRLETGCQHLKITSYFHEGYIIPAEDGLKDSFLNEQTFNLYKSIDPEKIPLPPKI